MANVGQRIFQLKPGAVVPGICGDRAIQKSRYYLRTRQVF